MGDHSLVLDQVLEKVIRSLYDTMKDTEAGHGLKEQALVFL